MIHSFSQCSIQDIAEHLSDIIGHPRLHPDECLRNDDYSGFSICEYYNVERFQCETPPTHSSLDYFWTDIANNFSLTYLDITGSDLILGLDKWKNFYKHITKHFVKVGDIGS